MSSSLLGVDLNQGGVYGALQLGQMGVIVLQGLLPDVVRTAVGLVGRLVLLHFPVEVSQQTERCTLNMGDRQVLLLYKQQGARMHVKFG